MSGNYPVKFALGNLEWEGREIAPISANDKVGRIEWVVCSEVDIEFGRKNTDLVLSNGDVN